MKMLFLTLMGDHVQKRGNGEDLFQRIFGTTIFKLNFMLICLMGLLELKDGTIFSTMVIYSQRSLKKFLGKHIVPYFFEDGYENHQYESEYEYVTVNATEAMERMEEMLDLFKEHTCVEFKRLRTEEEINQYEYIIMIVHDENNEGTCEAWSNLGSTKKRYLRLIYI